MKPWIWIVLGVSVVAIWLLAMSLHTKAQEAHPPRSDQLRVEWHIRAFIATKDRNPVTISDYSAAKFTSAKDCLAVLARPDAKLRDTQKAFTAAAKAQFGSEALIDWSCAPALINVGDAV